MRWGVVVLIVVMLSCGCSDDAASVDATICELIDSLGPDSTDADAKAVVEQIEQAGDPESDDLRDVQDHIAPAGKGLQLYISSFEDLAATCAEAGVDVDLSTLGT